MGKVIFKKILAILIIISMLSINMPIFTVFAETQQINLKIKKKPVIDIYITKSDTSIDPVDFKNRLEQKLKSEGITEDSFNLKIAQTVTMLSSNDVDVDDIVNGWTKYAADTWSLENGALYSRTGGGYTQPSWWGTAILDPQGFSTYEYDSEFTMVTGGKLNEGACFNVTVNDDGSLNGYFISICNHHNSECRLWRFDHYTLNQAFDSGVNNLMYCGPNGRRNS